MANSAAVIQSDTAVRDVNGEELGHVADIWPYVPAEYAWGSPVPGQAAPKEAEVGYFSVDHGGLLGIGTKHLYVPFKAIRKVTEGESIMLNCSKQECKEMYCRKPWFVDRDID